LLFQCHLDDVACARTHQPERRQTARARTINDKMRALMRVLFETFELSSESARGTNKSFEKKKKKKKNVTKRKKKKKMKKKKKNRHAEKPPKGDRIEKKSKHESDSTDVSNGCPWLKRAIKLTVGALGAGALDGDDSDANYKNKNKKEYIEH
jgi:hypothetical protein